MKIEIFGDLPTTNEYPYLAKSKDYGLVLVGRHSTIMLEPEHAGYGWAASKNNERGLSPLARGVEVKLTQE